jgi:hypothetical protein
MPHIGEEIPKFLRDGLDERLNLTYMVVFSPRKASKILFSGITFTIAILYLRGDSSWMEFFFGAGSLLIFIRLLFGTPMETRLTPEAFQRLQQWLTVDEESDE